jgi:hypothetical protein
MTMHSPMREEPIELDLELTHTEVMALLIMLRRIVDGGPITYYMKDFAEDLLQELDYSNRDMLVRIG